MSHNFFQELPGFTSFSEACNAEHYHPAPQDWYIVLTDVQGSTKAIEAGRYKDVNMVGAACITAAANSCGGEEIPYVFGGDGATFLVPPQYIERVKSEMLGVARLAKSMHDLTLRCGVIPMHEITQRGESFGVAKYTMPTGTALAMFNGGGAALADDLVKNDDSFAIKDQGEPKDPDLGGLSCRWQPLPTRRGTMLTLLVMALPSDEEGKIYNEVNAFIAQTLSEDSKPISEEHLSYKWPTKETLRQSQLVWRQGNVMKNLLGHIFVIPLFNVINRLNLKLFGFDVSEYKQDVIMNSDYRKFDGVLRMVVDCTMPQAEAIEAYLKQEHDQGRIVFGTHYSDTALMTCFVEALQKDKHVHFIDGNDGGYALAAKAMKERLSNKVGG